MGLTGLRLFVRINTIYYMYMILQHIYVISKHIEIYIKNRPKLLFAAVILFSLIWAVLGPVGGCDKVVFYYLNKDKMVCLEPAFADFEQSSLNQDPTYIEPNVLGVLTSEAAAEDASSSDASLGQDALVSLVDDNTALGNSGPITFISQEPRDEAVNYIVQQGDSPSTIAASFGISVNTLLWANKLNDGQIIRAGDELVVLPVSGVLHKVKDGEIIGTIAKKYKADQEEIIAFNVLPADGEISVGQQLIVPEGVMPAPAKPKVQYVAGSNSRVTGPGTGKSRSYPYGQCTWYVAQKRYVPWSGHAKAWLANASAMGFSVCWGAQCQPQAGAIVSLKGSSWLSRLYGHVAYIESVSDGWFTISEMNHTGWAVRSVRTIQAGSSAIAGFIY